VITLETIANDMATEHGLTIEKARELVWIQAMNAELAQATQGGSVSTMLATGLPDDEVDEDVAAYIAGMVAVELAWTQPGLA
jgi:hypothetical protein